VFNTTPERFYKCRQSNPFHAGFLTDAAGCEMKSVWRKLDRVWSGIALPTFSRLPKIRATFTITSTKLNGTTNAEKQRQDSQGSPTQWETIFQAPLTEGSIDNLQLAIYQLRPTQQKVESLVRKKQQLRSCNFRGALKISCITRISGMAVRKGSTNADKAILSKLDF
jgi:hypothetical protein